MVDAAERPTSAARSELAGEKMMTRPYGVRALDLMHYALSAATLRSATGRGH